MFNKKQKNSKTNQTYMYTYMYIVYIFAWRNVFPYLSRFVLTLDAKSQAPPSQPEIWILCEISPVGSNFQVHNAPSRSKYEEDYVQHIYISLAHGVILYGPSKELMD